MTDDDKKLCERMDKMIAEWARDEPEQYWWNYQRDFALAKARIEAQAAEIARWRECALYDATMDGPVFKGWDRSALERCRLAALGGNDE